MSEKKKLPLPLLILIISVGIGLLVCGVGLIKQGAAKKTNEDRAAAALKASEEAVAAANARLAEIGKEYEEVKAQYNAKADECDAIVTGSDGWFEKSNKCSIEKQELQSKMWDLESEDKLIKAKDYTGYYQKVKPMTYQIFYIIGGAIAFLGVLGAFIIYLVKGKKSY